MDAQNGAGGLVEEEFEALVTALPARLGRNGGQAAQGSNGEVEGCFVALGNIKSLSRHHATIEWDFGKGCYRVSCHSELMVVAMRDVCSFFVVKPIWGRPGRPAR